MDAIQRPTPAPPTVRSDTELITPAIARAMLTRNIKNRTVRPMLVNAYAADMSAGLWQENGEPIIFNTLGQLMDGQHRLAAIVKSEVSLRMVVTRNVSPEAMHTIDVGRRRTVGDVLKIEGRENTPVAASVARLALLYDLENYSAATVNGLSSTAVHAYYTTHAEAVDAASKRANTYKNRINASQSVLGTAFYLFYREDAEACEQFFNALINMRTDGEGDPRLALTRRLQTMQQERTRANQLQTLDLFINAWNAWREGRELIKLPLAKTATWRKAI